MPPLRRKRNAFLTAIAMLAVIDLAAGVFLLSPWGRSRQGLEEEYSSLRAEWQKKSAEVAPLTGMDEKLALARKEIPAFYTMRLPGRSSQISEELGKLAGQNSVKISEVKYEAKDAEIPGLQRLNINASATGDYLQIVKFINSLERDKLFFILDGISLVEQQGGLVRLQLQVETYVRGT